MRRESSVAVTGCLCRLKRPRRDWLRFQASSEYQKNMSDRSAAQRDAGVILKTLR